MSAMTPLEELRMTNTHRSLDLFVFWSREHWLLLSPPYQRGDVWGTKRRVNLIRSIVLGIPISAIVVNDRLRGGWDEGQWQYAVIDGKQRCTTILMFFRDELRVPGWWFGMQQESVCFSEIPKVNQRRFRNYVISFDEACLPNLQAEEEVFELINFGGVRQGERDE